MEILNNLFLIGFFLSFMAFIIGMVKPTLLKLSSRKRVSYITLVGLVLFFILFGVTQTDDQKAKIAADLKDKEQKELSEKKKTELEALEKLKNEEKVKHQAKLEAELEHKKKTEYFGLTVREFKESFNSYVEHLKPSDRLGVKPLGSISFVTDDGVKKFIVKVNPQLEIIGDVSSTGYVKNIAIFATINGNSKLELAQLFQAYSVVITYVLVSKDQAALPILIETFDTFSETGKQVSLTSNKIEFLLTPVDDKHLILMISQKE